jgi:hypothetical protein
MGLDPLELRADRLALFLTKPMLRNEALSDEEVRRE